MMHIRRLSYCSWRRFHLLAYARTVYGKLSPATVNCCSYVRSRNGQMFHSQSVNMDGCRLVTDADETEISRRLCNLQTAGEIMDFVSVVDSESWTPNLSSLLTGHLVSTHYQSLCAVYPWLQDNVFSASKQLRLGNTFVLRDATAAVHLHSAYETWMNIVERNCTSYSPDQLASALLSAINLFVDFDSSVVQRLLSETHKHLPEFSLTAAATLSTSLKALPGNNDLIVRALLKRVQTLLATVESLNAAELVETTAIFAHLRKFLNYDLQHHLVTWLLKMINNNKEALLNPTCIEAVIRLGYIDSYRHECSSHRLIDIGIEMCQKYVDQLDVSDVAKMCILLQTGASLHDRRDYRKILRHVFDALQSRALHLLSSNSRLCEVIDLMNCLTRHTSQQVILRFYGALHSRLVSSDYIDILSLSSIARTLTRMLSVNTDLVMFVQHFVVEQADNIVPHPPLFRWVEKFLGRHHFLDKDLERQFNDSLLSYVRRYIGVSTKYATSVVSAYLLPVSNDCLPTPVFENVITSVTRWNENALHKHTVRISSLQGSVSPSYQLKQLNSVLYQSLCKQLDLVDSLNSLHSLACSLLMHSCQQHPVVTNRVMNMYAQYSSTLPDSTSAWRVARVFGKLDYYLPPVYDDLVRYILTTNESDTEVLVAQIVSACGKVGYVPRDAEELLQLASNAYHRLIAIRRYKWALKLLYSLTSLQLYLDSELSKLFTLETLENLDHYMAVNRSRPLLTEYIEAIVMFLNRAVVLECPHLDVPWFRDRASRVFLSKGVKNKSHNNALMVSEVRRVLTKILGGGLNCIRSGVYSQYHYYLDFECLFDEQQKPVDVLSWPQVEKTGNCQKIAVCILGRRSYCYNSKQLNGFALAKKRHLEILNYKFVEIPYFDWFSMALADEKAKLDYVQQKLFQ